MKKVSRVAASFLFLVLFSGWLFIPAYADDSFEEMSTGDMLYVRGLVSSVSVEKMQISVRPPQKDRMVITIDSDTVLEGVKRIEEVQKEQQVKVWYVPAGSENLAVKIVKMMDLGC